MNFKYLLLSLLCYLCQLETNIAGKITYIATEHPTVVYFDKKFIKNVTVLSRRYSRNDPLYYINTHIETLVSIGNNASVHIYFYEFHANRYYRTFVEMHSSLCDFVETSSLFGNTLRRATVNHTCPYQPGHHHFPNLTIPLRSIPQTFPYRQGRLFCNVSLDHDGMTSRLGEAYIDLEVKVASGNKIIKQQ